MSSTFGADLLFVRHVVAVAKAAMTSFVPSPRNIRVVQLSWLTSLDFIARLLHPRTADDGLSYCS